MGVDVRLLPLIEKDFWTAHDQLGLERRQELWPLIEALPSRPLPEPLCCFLSQIPDGLGKERSGYGEIDTDSYGAPLRYVTVSDLLTLLNHPAVKDNWKNRAVWASLSEMPADWPIVIFWH